MFLVAFTGSVKYNKRMNDITKNKIARTSELLFNAHGYNNVTMRQIADACGISVGNLTYHYPKKEDLLMLEHDGIMNSFLDRVFADGSELTGLRGYFTVEAAFLHRILNDPPVARLYVEVINVPTLRSRYCRTHFELYRRFLPEVPDGGAEWRATVAMSALEFELADEGLFDDFERTMCEVFCARMLFEGKEPSIYIGDIHSGVSEGVALSMQIAAQE